MATNRRNGGNDASGGESAPEKKRKKVVPEAPPEIVSITGDPFPAAPPKPEPGEMWVTLLDSSPWSARPSSPGERGPLLPPRPAGAAQGPEPAARWSEPIWRVPATSDSEETDNAVPDDDAEPGEQPVADEPVAEAASQADPQAGESGGKSLAELVQMTEFTAPPVGRGAGEAVPPDDAAEPVIAMPELELPSETPEAMPVAAVEPPAEAAAPVVDAAAEPMVGAPETAAPAVGLPEFEVAVIVEAIEAVPADEPAAEDAAVAAPAVEDATVTELIAADMLVIDVPESEPAAVATDGGAPDEPAAAAAPSPAGNAGATIGSGEPAAEARQGPPVHEVPVEDLLAGVVGLAGSAVRGVAAAAFGLVDGLAKGGRLLSGGLLSGARRVTGSNAPDCGSCPPSGCDSKTKK